MHVLVQESGGAGEGCKSVCMYCICTAWHQMPLAQIYQSLSQQTLSFWSKLKFGRSTSIWYPTKRLSHLKKDQSCRNKENPSDFIFHLFALYKPPVFYIRIHFSSLSWPQVCCNILYVWETMPAADYSEITEMVKAEWGTWISCWAEVKTQLDVTWDCCWFWVHLRLQEI